MYKYLFLILISFPLFSAVGSRTAAPALTERTYFELVRVDSKIETGNYEDAEKILTSLYSRNWRKDSYDKAVVARTFGYFYLRFDRYKEAFVKLEDAFNTGAFPIDEQATLVRILAQLYVVDKNIDKAVIFLETYLAEVERLNIDIPDLAQVYGLLALAYAQQEKFAESYVNIKKAISLNDSFIEDWYRLKFAIEYTKSYYKEAKDTALILVKNEPEKKQYYLQLSAIYNLLKEENLALASLELGYLQDLLEKPDEFINLSSFYLYKQNPVMAAQVIQEGFDNDLFEKDDKKMLKLLSDAWLYAKERSKSIDALKQAIKMLDDPDEDLIIQLVEVAFFSYDWDSVLEGYKISKDNNIDTDGKLDLLSGIANIELKNYILGKEQLSLASQSEKYELQANAWLEYLKAISG